jgi:hypothetical protein
MCYSVLVKNLSMNKIAIFLIGLLLTLQATAQTGAEFETEAFHAIDIGHSFVVDLRQSDEYSVTVEAPKELLDKIHVEVEHGVLEVKMKDPSNKWGWKNNDKEILVHITFPMVDAIHISGAVELTSSNLLSLDDLDLNVSGASEVNLNLECDDLEVHLDGASELTMDVKTDNLKLQVSGASEIYLRGVADDLGIHCAGASEIQAEALAAGDVDVECSGASSIDFWASGEVAVNARGASDIRYKCSGCEIESIETSGSSSVKKY